ncbi:hypothetical protein ANN_26852, partial [Periplaneta americana]
CCFENVPVFGSAYLYEVAFSYMNIIKNKYRSCLTDSHLDDALEELVPATHQIFVNLQRACSVKFHTNYASSKSDRMELKRGVFQGSPLSPLLFNLSIHFIIKELTKKHIIDQYGFQINSDLDSITMSAFADDIVLIGKSMNAAQELVMLVASLLQNIGLQLNVQKSAVINIHKGKLHEKDLFLHHESYIKAIGPEDNKIFRNNFQ